MMNILLTILILQVKYNHFMYSQGMET